MRAALYARVSTAGQAAEDRNSLDVQQAAYASLCAAQGHDPVATYTDVESGRRSSRTEYQRMLRDARSGAFDLLIVTFLDRFGRDQWEVMARLGELRTLGIEVVATEEQVQEFIFAALAAYKADEESKRLSQRITLAMNNAASRGVALSNAPYGYRRVDGKNVIEPAEAAVVRDVFRWYVDDNLGPVAIAGELNRRGVRPPKAKVWGGTTIAQMLDRVAYTGAVRWGETTTDGAFDPVIERTLFQRVQDRRERKRQLPGGRTQVSPYLLAGILRCGHCGGPMWGNMQSKDTRGGRAHYHAYICGRRAQQKGCIHWNRHRRDDLERRVLRQLSDWTRADDDDYAEEELQEALARVTDELGGVRRQLAENLDLYRDGAIVSLPQLRDANAELDERRSGLEAHHAALEDDIVTTVEASTRAASTPARAEHLAKVVSALTPQQAKALLQEMVTEIVVYEGDPEPRITI